MTSEMPGMPANPPRNQRADLKYRHKTSFYQDEADAKRMRAVFSNTRRETGYTSLSDFINAAVDDKIAALEQAFNAGQQWAPLGAREIPQGKPAGRPAAGVNIPVASGLSGGPTPPSKALVKLAGKIRADVTTGFSRGRVDVFYSANGREALVVAHDFDAQLSAVHSLELAPTHDSFFVRTGDGIGWVNGPGWNEAPGETALAREGLPGPEERAAELFAAVDRARAELEGNSSRPLEGHVGVFYREDRTQALVDRFDTGDQMSTLQVYRFNPTNRSIEVRTSEGFTWEDGGDIPLGAV
jgi:Centromere-binding protein ParB C-terminal